MFKRNISIRAKSLLILMPLLLLAISASAQINNCCQVDRQCATDDEWVRGYYAFRNSQCAAPVESQQQGHQTRSDRNPSQSNNCCFSGWQCSTNAEWISGYWAFRNDQCSAQAQGQNQDQAPRPTDDNQRAQYGRNYSNGQPQESEDGPYWWEDESETEYKSKRCTTREDGTSVCVVVLRSWKDFWRAYCRTYTFDRDRPECR